MHCDCVNLPNWNRFVRRRATGDELTRDQLICGSPELDFHALERVATYVGFFEREDSKLKKDEHPHPVICHFWSAVHKMSLEQKKRLMLFVTGCDRAPITGLGAINFVIQVRLLGALAHRHGNLGV